MKQLSSLRYLMRQGLPIRGYDTFEGNLSQLLQLRSEDDNHLSSWLCEKKYFSPEIISSHDLRPLCPTRWTVRTGAINAVIVNYSTLCRALDEISTTGRDE